MMITWWSVNHHESVSAISLLRHERDSDFHNDASHCDIHLLHNRGVCRKLKENREDIFCWFEHFNTPGDQGGWNAGFVNDGKWKKTFWTYLNIFEKTPWFGVVCTEVTSQYTTSSTAVSLVHLLWTLHASANRTCWKRAVCQDQINYHHAFNDLYSFLAVGQGVYIIYTYVLYIKTR